MIDQLVQILAFRLPFQNHVQHQRDHQRRMVRKMGPGSIGQGLGGMGGGIAHINPIQS
jgi:hypothetical protein